MLPAGVNRVRGRNQKVYYYWHPGRGTKVAEKPVRIPHEPETPDFWAFVARLTNPAPKTDDRTIRAVIAKYRASQEYGGLKPVSRRDYDRYLDELERRLGDYAADAITPPVVLQIRNSYGDRRASANHMLSVLRTLFGWAVEAGEMQTNPAREVKKVSTNSDGAKPWPEEMIQLALSSCRWEARMFVALAYYTGQRTADVLRMRLNSIIGGKIPVTQSKTGKALMLPIHRDLKPFIDEALARGSMVLVPGPDGRELTTNQWRALWTREMEKEPQSAIRSGGLVPHGLRKSAVVALKEAGCTNAEIQAVTGHSLQMIEHYSKGYNQLRQAEQGIRKMENARSNVLQTPAFSGPK